MHVVRRKKDAGEAGLRAVTVRVKPEEYELLRRYAESQQASLNAVISEAIAQYGARIRRRQWMAEVKGLQRRIREECGIGSDSVELIREAREERADQLDAASSTPVGEPEGGPKQ